MHARDFEPERCETKSCLACFEKIDRRAKFCPHCKRPQIRYFEAKCALATIVTLVLLVGAGIGVRIYLEVCLERDRSSSVRVLESHFVPIVEGDEGKPSVAIVGVVSNRSTTPIRAVVLEARILDESGRLIDVWHATVRGLEPAEEASFGITGWRRTVVPPASHEVRVDSALALTLWPDDL